LPLLPTRHALITLCALIIAVCSNARAGDNFDLKLGIGYDFVSHEYFIDSAKYGLQDSSLTISLLKKDYLNDKKALLYLSYNPGQSRHLMVESRWEQTSDIYRALGNASLLVGNTVRNLEAGFGLEIKNRFRGPVEEGEEVAIAKGNLSYTQRLTSAVEAKVKIYAEKVDFDSTGLLVYDYSRFGGLLIANILTRNLDMFFITGNLELRKVPDSTQLDYTLQRATLTYMGYVLGGRMSSEISIEHKNYNKPAGSDDYLLGIASVDFNAPISPKYALKPAFYMEYFNFNTEGLLSDYLLMRGGLLLEREYGMTSVFLGPKFETAEIMSTNTNGDDYDDDFFEYMSSVGVEFYRLSGTFLTLENQFGRRNYLNSPLFYSDFIFDRVNLIGRLQLTKKLGLDLLLSSEWEWHKIESDDSRLYLFSSAIKYSF